jgi:hypothetical protein
MPCEVRLGGARLRFTVHQKTAEAEGTASCISSVSYCKNSHTETFEISQFVFGNGAMIRTQTLDWIPKLKNGVTSANETESSARPSTSKTDENLARLKGLVRENRRITIIESAAPTVRCEAKTSRGVTQ